MSALRELRLSANQFDAIPRAIGELASLVVLDLSDNTLSGLSPRLTKLRRLKVLNVQRNAIDVVSPSELPPGLEWLNVNGNRLRAMSVAGKARYSHPIHEAN